MREAGLRLVDRVVDDLEGHVVQAATVVGIADIHARAFAHRVQAAQNGDRGGIVILPGSETSVIGRRGRRYRACRGITPWGVGRLQNIGALRAKEASTPCPEPFNRPRARQRSKRLLLLFFRKNRPSAPLPVLTNAARPDAKAKTPPHPSPSGKPALPAPQAPPQSASRRGRSRCTAGSSSSSSGAIPRASAISAACARTTPISIALLLARCWRTTRRARCRHPSAACPPGGRPACWCRPPHVRAAARCQFEPAQPVLHRQSGLARGQPRRPPGRARASLARGKLAEAAGAAFSRATKPARAADTATAWRATASSSPLSQAASGRAPASRAPARTRRRSASAVSWAATSRAWPGSSAHTRRSRKRRRPAAPSANSVSICGVSQITAMRAASSAWLRGSAPSSRNTRRSPPPAGSPVPMSVCAAPSLSRPATAQVPGPSCRAISDSRERPKPRPGLSRDIASSRLVLPEPFGPVITAIRPAGRQVSAA